MFLDKDTVICLLDKDDKDYDSNLLLLNMLPSNTYFDMVIEDVVTAEYYDADKDIMYRVNLSYDYFSYGKEIESAEERKLSRDIEESLQAERKSTTTVNNTYTIGIFIILLLVCIIIFSLILILI